MVQKRLCVMDLQYRCRHREKIRMKKKLISIILGSLMAMSLAACDAIKIEIEPTEMSISEADKYWSAKLIKPSMYFCAVVASGFSLT